MLLEKYLPVLLFTKANSEEKTSSFFPRGWEVTVRIVLLASFSSFLPTSNSDLLSS